MLVHNKIGIIWLSYKTFRRCRHIPDLVEFDKFPATVRVAVLLRARFLPFDLQAWTYAR